MSPSHIVVQLTTEGGPNPANELDKLMSQSKDSKNKGKAWFKSTLTRGKFEEPAGSSIGIIFYKKKDGKIDAVIARILKFEAAPKEIIEFYKGHGNLKQYWTLGGIDDCCHHPDLVRVEFDSLAEIPGVSCTGGLKAEETFSAQATHAFWDFPEDSFSNWKFPENCLSKFKSPLKWLRLLIDEQMN